MSPDVPVQVLGKMGALLHDLAERGESTVAELAERLGQPPSSVYRLLTSLRALDMVEQGESRGKFRLGLRFLYLAGVVQSRFDERKAALPVMERIHELTGETVFLSIRSGFAAVCIERLEGRRVQVLALRLGGSLPLHQGAAPRVLLAWEPEELWEEYIGAGPLEAVTAHTITDPAALRQELQRVRAQGYAVSDQDVTVGIAAIGAPIFDFRGSVSGALSLAGVRPEILGETSDTVLEIVLEGAREISRALGYMDEGRPTVTHGR